MAKHWSKSPHRWQKGVKLTEEQKEETNLSMTIASYDQIADDYFSRW
jgi:uncharacterized protein YeaC (DUF1315 family)